MKKTFFILACIVYPIAAINPVFNILDTNYISHHDYALLPKEAATELELDMALGLLDRTITPLGAWALKDLTYPTKDLVLVKQRQNLLKELVTNDQAFYALENSLKGMKDVINELLAYWNESDVLNIESKGMYFKLPFVTEPEPGEKLSRWQRFNNYLNSSQIALEWSPFMNATIFVLQHVGVRALNNTGFEFIRRTKENSGVSALQCVLNGLKKTLSSPFIMHMPGLHLFKGRLSNAPQKIADNPSDAARAAFATADAAYAKDKGFRELETLFYGSNLSLGDRAEYFARDCSVPREHKAWYTFNRQVPGIHYVSSALYTAAYDAFTVFLLYQQLKALNESNDTINKLRLRLTKTATIVKETEKLYAFCGELLPLFKDLPALKVLSTFVHTPPHELQELIKLLHTHTFTGEKSFFYRRGRVLFAHRTLNAIKNELLPLLRALAEIDAYLSMARLIKEHMNKSHHYCFVNFCAGKTHPQAIFTNFWLPLVTTREPILNSLIIGGQKAESLLLAGPNGCGKSTFMKAIAYNWAILPLSWGIAAADHAIVSPLTQVKTAINIKEDLQAGQSTYMAQKKRFDAICTMVETQQQEDRTLLLIDEPLSGTVEAEAADQTVMLGKAIAEKTTISAVVATHLELPTHLDEMTGSFTNYYPEVVEVTPGYFKQMYKLLPGKADWWFNDRAKRSRFMQWLSAAMA